MMLGRNDFTFHFICPTPTLKIHIKFSMKLVRKERREIEREREIHLKKELNKKSTPIQLFLNLGVNAIKRKKKNKRKKEKRENFKREKPK